LPAKSGGRVQVQSLVFNRVMDILPVSGWQILQKANDQLTVLLSGVHDGLLDVEVEQKLRQSLADQGSRR
jgi:hypothetical protein